VCPHHNVTTLPEHSLGLQQTEKHRKTNKLYYISKYKIILN